MLEMLNKQSVVEIKVNLNDPKMSLLCADCFMMTLSCTEKLTKFKNN